MFAGVLSSTLVNVVISFLSISMVSAANGFNPDVFLPTNKIIQRHHYPCEGHEVRTEDNYLLTLHRIPRGRDPDADWPSQHLDDDENILKATIPSPKKKSPVYLQHGILGSSADWIIHGPEKSLAYMLADQGHDVWLGNVRGNTYSRGHATLSPDDVAFWNFTFHEMAIYDAAATIDYILDVSGSDELYYIGHSMGTTMFWVLCSMRPEYNSKIKTMFSLAPVAFMSNARSPIRYFAPYAKDFELISRWFGDGEFLPRNALINFVMKYGCEISALEAKICENNLFIICGHDPEQFEKELLPIIFGHTPAGTSTKALAHYAQLIQSGDFRAFDYGLPGNMIEYGEVFPPNYNLSRITAPVSIHFSDNDLLANTKDVKKLATALPNLIGSFRVAFPQFNHLDFLYSKDINSLLNENIMNMIQKSESGITPRYNIDPEEIIIPNEDEDPVFNDISSLLKHKAYSIGKETLDNVMDLKMMTENKLKLIKEKTRMTIERNLKSLKDLLMLKLKKYSNGDSYVENKQIEWKNDADVYNVINS